MKIQRAEIWLVNLEPTVGAEIRKTRPIVVVSSDAVGTLPIRLVAPLTEWKDHFTGNSWIFYFAVEQWTWPSTSLFNAISTVWTMTYGEQRSPKWNGSWVSTCQPAHARFRCGGQMIRRTSMPGRGWVSAGGPERSILVGND